MKKRKRKKKTKEMNPFHVSERMKILQLRYKMYLNIMRKKGNTEDTGIHKQDENMGAKMGLAYYHMTLTCLR